MRELYIKYPICQTLSNKLSWSHYCELLTISDDTGVLVIRKLSRTTPGTIEKLTLPGNLAKNIRGKIVVRAEHQEV